LTLSCNTPGPTPTATILAGKMELTQNDTAFSINPAKIELEHLQFQKPFRYYLTIANNQTDTFEYQIKTRVPDYTETGYKVLYDNSTYKIEIPNESVNIEPHCEATIEIIVTKVRETGDRHEGWINTKQLSESQVKLEMISRLLLK